MKQKMSPEEIKSAVKAGYTQAISRGGCGCGCGEPASQGIASTTQRSLTAHAGYDPALIERLPEGAVQNSFGCGAPLAFADVRRGQVVLDIGSGAGLDCFVAAEKVGPEGRVIGLDMTPAMIERARENAATFGATNVEFRLGDAESMPVDDGSVDWIISNCVINLAPDKPRVFREAYRVMKPGGRLSVSDIVLSDDLPDAVANSVEALVGCVAGAVKEDDYLAAMREAGFVDARVEERRAYGRAEIGTFLDGCCSGGGGRTALDASLADMKDRLADRVWSARITARKP
jgi:SAM-dependent methyltransferase